MVILKTYWTPYTSQSLENCIQNLNEGECPFELTSDNGLEFKGSQFEDSLKRAGILHYFIRPRQPEENAKIERWWQIVEKLANYNDIPIIVFLYNNVLIHSQLKEYIGEDSTLKMLTIFFQNLISIMIQSSTK